jgi:hypothetical protein
LVYIAIVTMVLAGALIYQPTNHDAHTYRLPRMFHWLAEGRWHWIHTGDERLNWAGTTSEWVSLPLLTLTNSFQWLWVVNFFLYLLLPGLFFATFRAMGFGRRAAWSWMWLLPTAFCFVAQAGSIGNDTYGATFALLSVYFALSARTGSFVSFSLCVLSAALLTGSKASNIPLILPAAVALVPACKWLQHRLAAVFIVFAFSMFLSFGTNAALNHYHAGHWTGASHNDQKLRLESPTAGLVGNSLLLTLGSVQPPILPGAQTISRVLNQSMPKEIDRWLSVEFPHFRLELFDISTEENAGLGIGITIAFVFALIAQFWMSGVSTTVKPTQLQLITGIAAWPSLLVFCLSLGSEAAARLSVPYASLCFAGAWIVLIKYQDIVRWRSWRLVALICGLAAFPVVILSPARPLWPSLTILGNIDIDKSYPILQRALDVYSTYRQRSQALQPVKSALPVGSERVGFCSGGNDLEASLWLPYGSLRIFHVTPGDSPERIKSLALSAICVSDRTLKSKWNTTPEEFASRYNGIISSRPVVKQMVRWGCDQWYVITFQKDLRLEDFSEL